MKHRCHSDASIRGEVLGDRVESRSIGLGRAALHLARTAQRIHHTAELDEEAVTRRLDEPAVTFSDR